MIATPRSVGSIPSRRSVSIRSGCATMPAPRPASSLSTRSKISTSQPARRSSSPASRPLIEPPMTSARPLPAVLNSPIPPFPAARKLLYIGRKLHWRNAMALTMLDKHAESSVKTAWPAEIAAEFEREKQESQPAASAMRWCRRPSGCGSGPSASSPASASASTATCSTISGPPSTGGRGRQHVHDGTTVEYNYTPGETRHETYGPGQFKVHDLENLGDKEHGVHDGRVPAKRQQADAAARRRAPGGMAATIASATLLAKRPLLHTLDERADLHWRRTAQLARQIRAPHNAGCKRDRPAHGRATQVSSRV